MTPRRIHIIAHDIVARDAVGNFCVATARLMQRHGHDGILYAAYAGPGVGELVLPMAELAEAVRPDDAILFNFSTFDEAMSDVAGLVARRRVAYFHNITPPEFFAPYDPRGESVVRQGLTQIPLLSRFDEVLTNSQATARLVAPFAMATPCPPFIGVAEDRSPAPELRPVTLPETAPFLLFVGRMAPHKGLIELVRLFGACAALDPDLLLVLAGGEIAPGYTREIEAALALLPSAAQSRILRLGSVSDAVLRFLYGHAAGFVSCSRHEGFCVPLAEALRRHLPIFIAADPAMVETAGTAGIVLPTLAEDAAAILLAVLRDPRRRHALAVAAAERSAELDGQADGRLLLQALEVS